MKYTHHDKISHLCWKNSTKQLNENINICPKDNKTFDELKVKLEFLEKENSSLKEKAKRKQNIIQSNLDQNAELLKLNNSYVNNIISQYVENVSRNNEKTKKNQVGNYWKSLILNRVKEKICKIIKKIRNIVK